MLMSLPNSVGIDPAGAGWFYLKQVVDSCDETSQNEQTGVPGKVLKLRSRVFMLTSLPNSVGIEPASVVHQNRENEQTGGYRSVG